jgi:CHAT domain-containing protein
MDEQRQNAYLNLIDKLLTCPNDQGPEIIKANLHLIDAGLSLAIDQVAATQAAQRNQNTANCLQNFAAQLAETIRHLEVYRHFLWQVLQKTAQSNSNPQIVYPLLQANLDKLDENFALILRSWSIEALAGMDSREALDIAGVIGNFSNLIRDCPLGNQAENQEIALIGYEVATKVFNSHSLPDALVDIQNNLGTVYNNLGSIYHARIRGNRAENVEQAIRYYQTALQIRTRQAFPQDWADTQNNLGLAYCHRIHGSRADNIEQALAAYQPALQVYTREALPQRWAMLHQNLGVTYLERIRGEWAENQEQAIGCFKAALQVYTRETFSQNWAINQNHLGNGYSTRIRGDRAENLEQAIYCYQAALQVYTRETFPQYWAATQTNLATAYCKRIRGDRGENLEQAIYCYQAALQVVTREESPEQWAIQNNLGAAYGDRIKGDRAENLEQALKCYQAALAVRNREDFPHNWATTQNNLGTVYLDRIRGERAENSEQALAAFQAALQVHTREEFPLDWAMSQDNRGNAYRQRIRGERSGNLDQAIQCYQAALQVRTQNELPQDWAHTQHNLGTAYGERIHGDHVQNLKAAIKAYQAALQVRTQDELPQDWAHTQNNLGTAYGDLEKMPEAFACFRSALEIHTSSAFPIECLRAGRNLGNTAFIARRWSEAMEGYALAIDAVETSRTWAITDARRQEIVLEAINVYSNMVQACIKNGQLDKAIEYAERSRSKSLVDLMASNDLYQSGEIPLEVQEYLQQYESIQQRIDQERFGNNSGRLRELVEIGTRRSGRAALAAYNETIKSLEAEKQWLWEQLRRLDPVLAGQIQVSIPNFAALQQLIDYPTTAILSFYTTNTDTHIFVLRQNKITCHTCTGQGLEALQERLLLDNWLCPYVASSQPTKTQQEQQRLRAAWINQISPFLTELAQRLYLDDLIAQHLSGIEELILVPHLYLHQVPFAALPVADGQYLGDKFLLRYTPSCQILEFCQKRPPVGSQLVYGTVEDATEDLPYASFEGEQIAQAYNIPNHLRLKGRSQATVNNYLHLSKQVQVLHSSHHAQSRLDNPLESKLELGDGTITLGQLMTPSWRLPLLLDVFLSCCETGLGIPQSADDILTLSTGFLCAGARSVVSTLWSVDDLATALFSIFYYRHRKAGKNRPVSLQMAQEELRLLSGQTLATVYQPQIVPMLDNKFKQLDTERKLAYANREQEDKDTPAFLKSNREYKRLSKAADNIHQIKNRLKALCLEPAPFSHPFYWAAFTCSGLR